MIKRFFSKKSNSGLKMEKLNSKELKSIVGGLDATTDTTTTDANSSDMTVSNVLKTKHDTVKNSISNIR